MKRKFPLDIYRQLIGTDFRLLDELRYLARKQAQKSPSGARYCFPGREYLAKKLRCCVRTVSRSIARLKRLGILDATQRRPVRGIWRTNLYKIKHWLGWRAGQCAQLLRKPLHRGTRVSHIATRKREIESLPQKLVSFVQKKAPQPPPSARLEAHPIFKTWMTRGETPEG